jgi:sirohydrochlorin cobaltochelatase
MPVVMLSDATATQPEEAMSGVRQQGVILFAHGARDTRWSETLAELRQRVHARCQDAHVSVAFLEFQPPNLETALADTIALGCTGIDVVPIFWANGGHVANDLPPLLVRVREQHRQTEINLLPVLSELPGLLDYIADVIAETQSE